MLHSKYAEMRFRRFQPAPTSLAAHDAPRIPQSAGKGIPLPCLGMGHCLQIYSPEPRLIRMERDSRRHEAAHLTTM